MEEEISRIKFSQITTALLDNDHPFPARLLRGFSDLPPKDLKEFMSIWPDVPVKRKRSLLEELEELTESDTLVCFDEIAKLVVDDVDPLVRVLAIRLLWECEDAKIVPGLIELMRDDPDEGVRSTATSLLGRFVYLGELEEIPDAYAISAVKNLLEVVNSEDLPQVRLRALESLGYSSNTKVPALIRKAYESTDSAWVASALCAMGRSADEQWNDQVLNKLDSGDSDVLFEAVRAAGELEITSSLDQLFTIVEDLQTDEDIRLAAIWSLSQIGGPEVKDKLKELLEESDSEEEMEWIEKAIENLEVGSGEGLDFMNYKPEEIDEEDFDEDSEYEESEEDEIDLEDLDSDDFEEDEQED